MTMTMTRIEDRPKAGRYTLAHPGLSLFLAACCLVFISGGCSKPAADPLVALARPVTQAELNRDIRSLAKVIKIQNEMITDLKTQIDQLREAQIATLELRIAALDSQEAASAYTEDDQTEMITDLKTQSDRLRIGQRESLATLELHVLQIKELQRRVGLLPP